MSTELPLKYRTIVADPPWKVKRGSNYSWREGAPSGERMELDYPTMTNDEIAAIPVKEWVAPDAHLYMWTTQGHLRDAYRIVEAWGFKAVCAIVWCKAHRGWAPGGTFQSNVEFCLFARRGSLAAMSDQHSQWHEWPRGAHSAKPEAFMDLVESISPEPRLEMFSRRARLGWDTWGNQSLQGGAA